MSAEIDLATVTLSELAAAMGRGDVSSVGLLEMVLGRIESLNPALGAFTETFADQALKDAELRDRMRAEGNVCGVLHGIPVAFKDLVDIAGRRTTVGSRLFDGYVAGGTATIVSRLESAGMVTLGKTRMVELAFGGWGTNPVMGTPRNPWDTTRHRIPGGSSSGAAVAVAAGLAPVSVGSDTGGSVRVPAALCGLVGLKTTTGRIPVDGLIALSPTLDTVGPLTRTVVDMVSVFAGLAGEPNSVRADSSGLSVDRDRCRIGVLCARDLHDVDVDILRAYHDSVDTLVSLGADIREIELAEPFEVSAEKNGLLTAYEGWQIHGERIRAAPELMNPEVLARFRAGEGVTTGQYRTAVAARERDQSEMMARMDGIDALLTPTTPMTATEVDAVDETQSPLTRYTRPVNYFGQCALAVPAGLGANGLPMSVQFIGRPGTETTLFRIGLAFEEARGPFPAPDLSGFEGR
jgi:aspartyl-tRNA(Asn)/glutamyl-tRNA(Gln) amidotransferase subunit A